MRVLRLCAVLFLGYWLAIGMMLLTTPRPAAGGKLVTPEAATPAAKPPVPPCTATSCAIPADGRAPDRLWGVKADGASDDSAARNAAFLWCAAHPGTTILLSPNSRAAATEWVPGGCRVEQMGATAGSPPAWGVIADNGVSPILSCGESADLKGCSLHGVAIGRAGISFANPPPAGSIGLKVMGSDAVVEDVISTGSDVCVQFYGSAGEAQMSGFQADLVRPKLAGCRSYMVEMVGWAVLSVTGRYFGAGIFQGAVPEYDTLAEYHITGGATQCGGGGPNTLKDTDGNGVAFAHDIAQGDWSQAEYGALIRFSGLNPAGCETGIYQFRGNHEEEVAQFATSDATAPLIDLLSEDGGTFVGGIYDQGGCWFGAGLDPATELRRVRIANTAVYHWNQAPAQLLCLAPQKPISGLVLDTIDTYQQPPQGSPTSVSIVAPAGSWGRIANTDVPAAAISIAGDGAQGFRIGP